MRTEQVTLTMAEHDGRRWLVGAGGEMIAELACEASPCEPSVAIRSVRAALETERRRHAFLSEVRRDRSLRLRWNEAFERALRIANGSRFKQCEARDRWAKRIDSGCKAVLLMVKRGSNLRETGKREPFGSWERFLGVALQRSLQWYDPDPWGNYSNNLASNIRKRFRNQPAPRLRDEAAPEAGPQRDRRHEQEEDDQGHARGPGLQVLFDWG